MKGRLRQKTSMKSRRLPRSPDDFHEVQTTSKKSRRLPRSPDDFLEVQTTDFQEFQMTEMEVVWKTSLKSSRRLLENLLKSSSSALYFKRLPRRLPIGLLKSDPDLKNMYIKSRSEKPAYHINKRSNGLKTEKISGILDRSTFVEHTKIHI